MTKFHLLVLFSLWSFTSSGFAQIEPDFNGYTTDNSNQVTKARAVQYAKQAANGRVLKIESAGNTYQVKILQASGRVVVVEVDKSTGQIISNKQEDE